MTYKHYVTVEISNERAIHIRRDKILDAGYDERRETYFVIVKLPEGPSGTRTIWARDVSGLHDSETTDRGLNHLYKFETISGDLVSIRSHDVLWVRTIRSDPSALQVAFIQKDYVRRILTLDSYQIGVLLREGMENAGA